MADRVSETARKLRLGCEMALVYARVRLQVRRRPLPDLLRVLRRGVADPVGVERLAVARQLGWTVHRHLPRLPGDTRCLTQSLVLTGLLARREIGSLLVIAVGPSEDFVAHAWVEHDGVPLLPTGGDEFGRLVSL
jgi:hypothetical protein